MDLNTRPYVGRKTSRMGVAKCDLNGSPLTENAARSGGCWPRVGKWRRPSELVTLTLRSSLWQIACLPRLPPCCKGNGWLLDWFPSHMITLDGLGDKVLRLPGLGHPCRLAWRSLGPFCFTSTEARWLIRDGDRRGRGRKSDGSTTDTARKRPERPWTAARTMEVLRRCPLAIAQRLVHCAIALSTAVLGQSQGQCPLHCCWGTTRSEGSPNFAAQLHLPTHDLFWANLKVQLHLPPLDLLISSGTLKLRWWWVDA